MHLIPLLIPFTIRTRLCSSCLSFVLRSSLAWRQRRVRIIGVMSATSCHFPNNGVCKGTLMRCVMLSPIYSGVATFFGQKENENKRRIRQLLLSCLISYVLKRMWHTIKYECMQKFTNSLDVKLADTLTDVNCSRLVIYVRSREPLNICVLLRGSKAIVYHDCPALYCAECRTGSLPVSCLTIIPFRTLASIAGHHAFSVSDCPVR